MVVHTEKPVMPDRDLLPLSAISSYHAHIYYEPGE
jgi:hypothetical protein